MKILRNPTQDKDWLFGGNKERNIICEEKSNIKIVITTEYLIFLRLDLWRNITINEIRNIKGKTISAYLPIILPLNQQNDTGDLSNLPELWFAIVNKVNKIVEKDIIKK